MENLSIHDNISVPEDKITYTTKSLRMQAVGPSINDKIIDTLCKEAETLYIPKKIKNDGDWLVSHKEKGQPLSTYHTKAPVIKWSNPGYNTIILYMLDD